MALPSTLSLLGNQEWSTPKPHDYRAFTYIAAGAADDDDVATITYKLGGASGTTVATLTMTYVGSTNNILTMALTVP